MNKNRKIRIRKREDEWLRHSTDITKLNQGLENLLKSATTDFQCEDYLTICE